MDNQKVFMIKWLYCCTRVVYPACVSVLLCRWKPESTCLYWNY